MAALQTDSYSEQVAVLEVHPVNLVQAGGVFLLLFGLYLLKGNAHFITIKVLLVFSILSTITNFSEEVLGSGDWYLVSPVYLVGIGPMFYLCVISLTQNKHHIRYFLHLLPMIFALPFTHVPQQVIALGTVSFATYGMLSHKAITLFEKRILAESSNTEELSMKWFMNLVLAVAIIYSLDFVRLNLQPHIGYVWNTTGQLMVNTAIFMGLGYLIKKLLQFNEDILLFHNQRGDPENTVDQKKAGSEETAAAQKSPVLSAESPEQYQAIFKYLDSQIVEQQLFRLPRLSLAQLAHKTDLQTRDISRAINLCAKENFNDYINQHRVNAIKAEFENNPEASLLQIGLENGFNSKTSFNNVFKRLTKMTPGQFRADLNK